MKYLLNIKIKIYIVWLSFKMKVTLYGRGEFVFSHHTAIDPGALNICTEYSQDMSSETEIIIIITKIIII